MGTELVPEWVLQQQKLVENRERDGTVNREQREEEKWEDLHLHFKE